MSTPIITCPHCGLAVTPRRRLATELADAARLRAINAELLEALQEVVTISDRKHNAWDRARAAIAKARGWA